MNISILTSDPGETISIAARIAGLLEGGDVLALYGQLGAGKTCFVRGLAQGLGLDSGQVASPTFVIAHIYEARESSSLALVHVDAYRLTSEEDLASVGIDELISPDAIVAIEWPQRLENILPENVIIITIEHVSEVQRRLDINIPEQISHRFISLAANP